MSELEDDKFTAEEKLMCDANITTVTLSKTVSYNYNSYRLELGGDVPEGVTWDKFASYLRSQIDWRGQSLLKRLENENK